MTIAVLMMMLAAAAQDGTTAAPAAPAAPGRTHPLEGEWTVDLSTDPAKPYLKTLRLQAAADGSVSGSFYDSAIQAGRWKTDRGRTCVSFRTTDGTGPYHSAACVVDGGMQGQTWAEHRRFLFNWNATRR